LSARATRVARAPRGTPAADASERADVFQALADATRRGILDALRSRGTLTAGEVAEMFSQISRPGISRHLRVLRESGLVIAEEAGRERRYRLNVAALARAHRDWWARFTPMWEQSLEQLKRNVEGDERRTKRGA
jgi:DNA-binding transcriptional ArsR family regulator